MIGKAMLLSLVGLGFAAETRAEDAANLKPTGLPLNGSFEAAQFDSDWANKDRVGLRHPGLNGTSHAVLLNTAVTNEFEQAFAPVGPQYRLEMYFAAAEPAEREGIRRPASFDVLLRMGDRPGDGKGIIHLQVLRDNVLAYLKEDGSPETLVSDFKYSVDQNGNGNFTDKPGDVLHVYRLRVDATVDGPKSTWTLSISEPNAKELTRTFPSLAFRIVPPSGEFGLDEIKLRRLEDVTGPSIHDELVLYRGAAADGK